MLTTIVIGTTAYSSSGVAYAGFAGVGGTKSWASANLYGLRFSPSDEQYSTLEFTVIGCGPAIPFPPGLPVQLVTSNDDGSSPVLRFTGDLLKPEEKPSSNMGPVWSCYCTDLKQRGDNVTLLSSAGTTPASYNLSPTDPLYLFNLAGQTVGQILIDLLQAAPNAAALSAVGIGNYTIVGPVYTLPAQTLTDLAAMTIVPPVPVQLQGEAFFGAIEGFFQSYHPQFTCYVQPDGTIRFISIFGRTTHTLTLPDDAGAGDPVDELSYGIDEAKCFTAVQIAGQDIAGAVLKYSAGTLTHSTAPPSSPPWTLNDFTSPNDGADEGTSSSVTANTCVVHSDHASVHWVANFWNNNGGIIILYNLAASGVAITEPRQVTACTAMSPGGTATITWDSSLPLDSGGYTRYDLLASNTVRGLWDREFLVTEPATGNTGLMTWIGSHMEPIFPYGFAWANVAKGPDASVQTITSPSAKVRWSPTGAWPWYEMPVNVTLNPKKGTIVLSQPAVQISAGLAGQTQGLYYGYPANFFTGLWADIQVAVPYNRGDINTRSPATGYSGTAFTKYGIQRVKTIPLSSFVWKGNASSLNQLAHEILLTVQDAQVQGSIRMHYDAWTPTFDPFAIGYALNVVTPGAASDIDGLNLPVRSFVVEWPESPAADIRLITFTFSNRHRQFEGDSLYVPHAFSTGGWGMQSDQLFVAGEIGGLSGVIGLDDLGHPGESDRPGESEGVADIGGHIGGEAAGQGAEDWGLGRSGKKGPQDSSAQQDRRAARQNREDRKQERDDAAEARASSLQADRQPRRGKSAEAANEADQAPSMGTPINPDAAPRRSLRDIRGGASEPTANPEPPTPDAPAPTPKRPSLRDRRGGTDPDEGGS